MNFGEIARKPLHLLVVLTAALTFMTVPQVVQAQEEAATESVVEDGAAEEAVVETPAFEHYGPDMILGQPEPGAYGFQPQYSDDGNYALWMHDVILMPLIVAISLFVLGLLLWVVARYNKRANPVPSKTSHNTVIEVIWTAVPVLILLAIAVPSITLLARQYQSPPEEALTIKANGYQWYWGYEYVDNGGFEVISNMMDEAEAIDRDLPPQLAVDNRMVVPVGEPIRIQTFGADVIHSFGIPSLWFKIDAVPGRINERTLTIKEPGIYYGQCMELCGARHGYMPIAIEARPRAEFEAWVLAQGGSLGDEEVVEVEEAVEVTDDSAATEEVAAEA